MRTSRINPAVVVGGLSLATLAALMAVWSCVRQARPMSVAKMDTISVFAPDGSLVAAISDGVDPYFYNAISQLDSPGNASFHRSEFDRGRGGDFRIVLQSRLDASSTIIARAKLWGEETLLIEFDDGVRPMGISWFPHPQPVAIRAAAQLRE